MMKTLVKLLFFSLIALLATALIAPSFIDWNQHRADVLARIAPYFRNKVDVAGNISLRVLPQPEILLESVTVAGTDPKAPPVMTLKALEAHIKLQPLLEGRVEVETISLAQPALNLTVYPDGKTSLSDILAPTANLGAAAGAVRLNEVKITDGTLNYANQLTGTQKRFENLNLAISADTLLGPYKVSGDTQYQKTKVALEMDTGVFDNALSAPTHINFTPAGTLPQVKISGDLSLQAGLDLEGEVSVAKGSLSSLLNIPALEGVDFLHEPAELTGTLVLKGNQFALNDIKAKFGKGTLKGKVAAQVPKSGAPTVTADLEGNSLSVTGKPSENYMSLPSPYQGSFHFKGKNIIWDGRTLGALDATLSFNDKDWTLKSVQASLPGDAQIKLTGVVTPKANSATYSSVQIAAGDLGKMVEALAPAETSIFSALAGTGPVRKLQLSSNVDVTPARISFFNIDATAEDKAKITGVINVERVSAKPNVTAKLHLTDWNSGTFTDAFAQTLMKAEADLEITAGNFTKDNLTFTDLAFKGKTGGQGLEIAALSGTLSSEDAFSLKGRVAGLSPVTGLDATYTLKTAAAADIAKSLGLPPLGVTNADLKGTLKGDAGKYVYTVEGTGDALTLSGLVIDKPAFKIDVANPAAPRLAVTEGSLWGGKMAADIGFSRTGENAWAAAMKGGLKGADFKLLQEKLGFKGFALGSGDLDIDIASPDASIAAASGTLNVQNNSVTLENYNSEKLPAALQELKSLPEDLGKIVNESFHKNGSSVFKDFQAKLQLDHGTVTIDGLALTNAAQKLTVTGTANLADSSYTLSGDVKLNKAGDMPPLKLKATEKSYTVESSKALEDYVVKNLPPPPPAALQPEVAPIKPPAASVAPVEAPAAPPPDQQPIQDILKRLDEPEPAPEPAPIPDPKPLETEPQADPNAPVPLTTP